MDTSRGGPAAPAGRQPMNFVRDVVEAAAPEAVAVVERTHSGDRREHTFAALAERSARLAGTLHQVGVGRGDVVLLLIGNRVEWVESLLACFRIGAAALPAPCCSLPTRRSTPRTPCPALSWPRPTRAWSPSPAVRPGRRAPSCTGSATCSASGCRPCTGLPPGPVSWPGVPPPPAGRSRPATPSSRPGWAGRPRCCTTPGSIRPSGWRWRRGKAWRPGAWPPPSTGSWPSAACCNRSRVCTPWWRPARPSTRRRCGCGGRAPASTSGTATARPRPARSRPIRTAYRLDPARWDGRCPGSGRSSTPASWWWTRRPCRPYFLRYLGQPPPAGRWRTGDQVRQDDDGYLYFEGRTDDVIISAGYRIGPFEVESVLARHPAVADVAVVAAPDAERGSVVRAIVVLQPGGTPSAELASELQDFVKQRTAPYKYPRLVEFVTGLPKTTSGKIRRRELRLAAESP